MSNTRPQGVSPTVLLVCITVVVCFTISIGAAVFIAAPDGANTGSLLAILMGQLATTIGTMVSVVKLYGVADKVENVAQDTERLSNGGGDAKVRTAVAAILAPHLIDPGARAQLAADAVTNAAHEADREERRK